MAILPIGDLLQREYGVLIGRPSDVGSEGAPNLHAYNQLVATTVDRPMKRANLRASVCAKRSAVELKDP